MLETFLRWAARALAGILERYADPDLEARLKAYNAKVEAQEQKIRDAEDEARASEAAYQTSLQRRNELNFLLKTSESFEAELEKELAESNKRIAAIKEDVETAKKELDSLPAADRVRVDL